jgi:hypothetical protein
MEDTLVFYYIYTIIPMHLSITSRLTLSLPNLQHAQTQHDSSTTTGSMVVDDMLYSEFVSIW